jgi:L-asparaginase II
VHRVHAVAVRDGAVVQEAGDATLTCFMRSSSKPIQALPLVRARDDLTHEDIAIACASHRATEQQLAAVQALLTKANATEDDLELGLQDGRPPQKIANNCSGKHAGMLATCRTNGWDTSTYLLPSHPLQRAIAETIADLAGEAVAGVGVDGCGAPLFAVSPLGLAVAFARIAAADPRTPEGRVALAVRTYPEWLGGTGRAVTRLVRGVPGLVAKDGAEGVFAAALPDGRAAALKIADGGDRPRTAVLAALLHRLGVEAPVLDEFAEVPVLGHGAPVGRVEVTGLG